MSNIGAKAKERRARLASIEEGISAGDRCPDCWCLWSEEHRQVRRLTAENYGDPCDDTRHAITAAIRARSS